MFLTRLKRDLLSIYFSLAFFKHYFKKEWASCFATAARIELLESHISNPVSYALFGMLRNKYEVAECSPNDPYVLKIKQRFAAENDKRFLENDVMVIKPYVSEEEKGVLMITYSEIINAIPFLFDIHKLQQRYHFVLEQSSESPFQPFNGFYSTDSLVFIQSVSERERMIHRAHSLIPVPITSGDWVNKDKFQYDPSYGHVYDFCIISNFIPIKRYPFLFSALSKYWKGDLKFAIVASKYIGRDRAWIDKLLKEYGLTDKADVFIQIPPTEVNKIMNQSYCHVLCSVREGSPKVPAESMITGTPTVVYKHHIGFPNWKFNPPLIYNYTNEEDLVTAIKQCAQVDKKEVARLAHEQLGSDKATAILNEEIKAAALKAGEQWTMGILEKVNNVLTYYKDAADVNKCLDDYRYIETCANKDFNYSAAAAIEILSK